MLKIRREQYEALRAAYRELYVDRTRDYFRRNWFDACEALSDEQLSQLVREARDRAETYGITIEADVVRFTEVWLLLGGDFDRSNDYPWAEVVLTDQDTSGTIKTEQIVQAAAEVLDDNGAAR